MGSRHNTSTCGDLQLKINDAMLEKVTTFKYLGITLYQNLTYDSHIMNLNKNIRHKVFLLRTVRPFLTKYAALQVYRAMILPIVEYGNILYDSANQKLTSKLQVAQNSGLKAVYCLPRLTPTQVLHNKAKINLLELRRKRSILIQSFHRAKIARYVDTKIGRASCRERV